MIHWHIYSNSLNNLLIFFLPSWGKKWAAFLGQNSDQPSWGKRHHQLGVNLNLVLFIPKMILFTHGKKFFGKKKQIWFYPKCWSFSLSGLTTILLQEVCSLLPPKEYWKKKEKRREIEWESEDGEKVIWCEEIEV